MKLSVSLAILLLVVGPCVGCTSGNLRLTSSSYGVLQICKSSEWRMVCSRDWGHLDAAVACRQLGYDGGYTQSTSSSSPGLTVDPVEYHCNGRENNLQNCDNESNSWCSSGVTIACVQRNASDPCSSGDIRLWGGQKGYEGNVELCTDHGVWSAVCHNSWGNADAVVACRQLGYTGIAVPYDSIMFGQRIQPMEFGGLSCSGTESTLQECAVSSSYVRTWSKLFFCNERDYAGLRCIPRNTATCTNGDVRLTNGYSSNNGFAEICIDGAWIGACQSSSTGTVASSHICSQLGYPRHTGIDQSFFPPNRTEPLAYVTLTDRRCDDESSVLLDCVSNYSTYGIPYQSSCTSYGILCCPNDPAMCAFQPRSPLDPTTTPPVTQTTPGPVDEEDKAEFSLDFGTAATSLILSSSGDLRGLEEDIQKRFVEDILGKCDCLFDASAFKGGFFSFGESVTYHSKVLGVAGQSAVNLVNILKRSIEKDPLIQYHSADIYLAATLIY